MIYQISLKIVEFQWFGGKKHISAPKARKHQYSLSNIKDSGNHFSRKNAHFTKYQWFSPKHYVFHENTNISLNFMISGKLRTSAWKVPPQALVLLRGNWCFADSVKCIESYAKDGICLKIMKSCRFPIFAKKLYFCLGYFQKSSTLRRLHETVQITILYLMC